MRNLLLFVSLCLLALAARARADAPGPRMTLRTVPTGGAPMIEATITDGPALSLDRYVLVDDHHTRVPAAILTPWVEMKEPVAIAILVAGSEVIMGNTSIEPPRSPARYPGYLAKVRAGLAALDLARSTPAGSQGLLVTYEDAPRVRVPVGPIAALTADALGTERDYYQHLGTDLVGGLTLALSELGHARASRKVLIVIGDGNDTDNAAAAARLEQLRDQAERDHVETFGILYHGALSPPGEILSSMIPRVQAVPSADAIPAALAAIRAQLASRYVLTFPGYHLRWNGDPMYLTVDLGGTVLPPILLYSDTAPAPGPVAPAPYDPLRAWWFQVAIGLGLAGVLALLVRRRAARASLPAAARS